ncbi:hypothetical protein GDO81_008448 [Engystomops pustulosus]|uniref:Uncharacterized protein n=1 Tax=Engystomops pustulosus TaxID=76066 RepID=A0AAV7CFE4_ENGPU|nr:hypothetical protein GDO81_008448 [Engystomops pustulosus]
MGPPVYNGYRPRFTALVKLLYNDPKARVRTNLNTFPPPPYLWPGALDMGSHYHLSSSHSPSNPLMWRFATLILFKALLEALS